MIGIRTITYQLPEKFNDSNLDNILRTSRIWNSNYNLIRTQRISLYPFEKPVDMSCFNALSKICDISSVRWFNVPIDPFKNSDKSLFDFGYDVLKNCPRAFVNVLGVQNNISNRDVLMNSAALTRRVSQLSNDGKDNFRLGLSVNIKPNGPFFPFTYSSGKSGFSIGLELTQDINFLCESSKSKDLSELRDNILICLIPQIDKIEILAKKISKETGLEFNGFDFSLAPIIGTYGSIVSILNTIGVYDFGKTGGMFATSYLTNILKHLASRYKSVGFSGVMYSLLEDLELCSINNQRGVTLEQMITLSTMCGCGVDMIPVYGKMTNEEFMSVYLEIIGISSRLNRKPLGIRILPIPNCKRGNNSYTCFTDDSDFIANTKVVTPSLNLISEFGDVIKFLTI